MDNHIGQQGIFLVAEIELYYKTKMKIEDQPVIKSTQSAYNIILSHRYHYTLEYQEEFKILLLNCAGRVLGMVDISKGGMTGTVVDAKMIFGAALKANAYSIILAHNHPSGNLTPSQADKLLTEKIRNGGKILDIVIMYHLIITKEGYYSFADNGQL